MISHFKYHFRVRQVIKEIENEKGNMIRSRSEHERARGTRATDRTRMVNDALLEWLDDTDKFIEEEKNLKMKIEAEAKMRKRYAMYNEMLMKIKELNSRCGTVANPDPNLDLDSFLSRKSGYSPFESTKKAWDQLWEALNNKDGSHIIRLYGEPGSGKTTLAMTVVRKVNYYNDFKKAIFISLSENPDPERIQSKFAESLRLFSPAISRASVATLIFNKLSKGRYLVVLDDVGAEIDLEDICIPWNSNMCKVLLISRQRGECTSMERQQEIVLSPLSEEEALMMLKKYSDIDDESPSDLLNVAEKVAFECKGLPATIKEVASSLKDQPIEKWKASLNKLRSSDYQVFLSFRGEDTRYSFTGHLYHALRREGFKTFMDEDGLQRGNQISESLIKAIENSKLSIIILSESYAYSSWCLEELVTILECRKTKNQQILPIFYKVDPSDIRHLNNNYGEAMAAHKQRFGNDSDQVQRWSPALFEVANLSGKHYKTTEYEYKFIQEIVEEANKFKSSLDED